jgi:hypothetical protein
VTRITGTNVYEYVPAGLWRTTGLERMTGPSSGLERGVPNASNIQNVTLKTGPPA